MWRSKTGSSGKLTFEVHYDLLWNAAYQHNLHKATKQPLRKAFISHQNDPSDDLEYNRNLPKVEFIGLVVAMSATKCNYNCVTNFMEPICILCNLVFSDVKTYQNTSKSHLYIDLTSQSPLSHA